MILVMYIVIYIMCCIYYFNSLTPTTMEELPQGYKKCEKCRCHYKWEHQCDWLMTLLVKFFNRKQVVILSNNNDDNGRIT